MNPTERDDGFRHAYATVDGVELHWGEMGEASALPPVVMLHGMMDAYLTWRKVAVELSRDRLVLMPDLPGCGLSGRPDASYGLQWQAGIIAGWMAQLGLAQVDVVGHSYGGGVAQMLLLACPERIRRMVLAASGGLGTEVGFWLKFGTFPFFVERFGQPFMAFGTQRTMARLIKVPATDAQSKEDILALSKMNAKPGTARAFSRTVRDVINFRGQTRHFLHRAHEVIKFPPIAIFWGTDDTLIPIDHGESVLGHLEGSEFKAFANCGHYLHHEQANEFVDALRTFLDKKDATPVTLSGPTKAA